ncbi:hypothetical protein [Spirosoma validum]|uniref:DUF1579 domain-containing protein n=1 Tax=Spirosoma validum TaxID=2771355 RepID=A0A927B647_9BACT|nr:hypothetical protein [Spirosoma validum]MBD2756394.1 hypothetical protein [Spirosoma validum]
MSIKALFTAFVLLAATFQFAKAQTSSTGNDTLKTFVGKWSGTYAGDSSGKFELVIKQDNGQKLTGQVLMLTDDPNQKPINLKTISWKDGTLSATYTDPAEGDEVSFTGIYTNPDLEGSWKSDEGQSTGTWQLTRVDP